MRKSVRGGGTARADAEVGQLRERDAKSGKELAAVGCCFGG